DAISNTAVAQPALFALQYALAALWRSWGVSPDAVLGHSVGEYAAACVAGVLDMPAAARLVAGRGRLMQERRPDGARAAVGAPESRVAKVTGSEVSIAAVNGPELVVIAGRSSAVSAACASFEAQGVRTERLAVKHAFHTMHMTPMIPNFAAAA